MDENLKKLQIRPEEELHKDCVDMHPCAGKPVYYRRWIDCKIVAFALIGIYQDITCPLCGGKKFKIYKNSIPGTCVCSECNNALMMEKSSKKRAELIYIYSHIKGKGYARDIIEAIKVKADRIITSWDESTEEGRKFCMACGMVHKDNILEWDKPKED